VPGYVDTATDCDDTTAAIGEPAARYIDADGDGIGSTTSADACPADPGYADTDTDCDDGDASVGAPTLRYPDADGDGFGDSTAALVCPSLAGYVDNDDDCDDNDAATGAGSTFYADLDADSFGDPAASVVACSAPSGYLADNTDCDDSNASAYPGGADVCGDSVDGDCDGVGDDSGDDEDGDGVSAGQESADNAAMTAAGYTTAATASDCVADDDSDGDAAEGRSDSDYDGIYDYLDDTLSAYAVINAGAAWTNNTAVQVSFNTPDGANQVCVSNTSTDCSSSSTAWVSSSGASPLAHTLTSGSGTKTVYIKFRDAAAPSTITSYTDTIGLDTARPVNGTVSVVAASEQVTLSWSGYSDARSGLASTGTYVVVYDETASAPTSCAAGVLAEDGTTDTSLTITGLTDGVDYTFRVCAYDAAGNLSLGSTTTEIPNADQTGPTGSVSINSGDAYTGSTAVTLSLSATDTESSIATMCISASSSSCTSYVAYASSAAHTLAISTGTKTVYAWFKDSAGNLSAVTSDTIVLDATKPTDGTFFANRGASGAEIALTWTASSDAHSGVASYTVAYKSGSTAPTTCTAATGTTLVSGLTGLSTTITGLSSSTAYAFRMCSVDNVGNVSTGRTAATTTAARLAVDTPDGEAAEDSAAVGKGCATTPGAGPGSAALLGLLGLAAARRQGKRRQSAERRNR
jgi:MYXO-CTERM domain-containing protein